MSELKMPEVDEGLEALPDDEAPPNGEAEQLELPLDLPEGYREHNVTHVYHHVACGQTAFGLFSAPARGQNIMAMPKLVRDGPESKIQGGTRQRVVDCSHCGLPLVQLHHRHVIEVRS